MENTILKFKSSHVSHLHQAINRLQSANHQLEQMIQQAISEFRPQLKSNGQQVADSIRQSHEQLQKECSWKLMNDQIRTQQQKQMKEILRNYEKRVIDLRNALVNKQAEIVDSSFDLTQEVIPTSNNLRLVNKQSFQKGVIKKLLQELKKLKIETQALQYYIQSKADKQRRTVKKGEMGELTAQAIKSKLEKTHKDKLLAKIYDLLHVQLQKQSQLQCQLELLKIQQKESSKIHNQYIQKYKNQHYKHSSDNQINFLAELQKADKQASHKMFNKIDQNIEGIKHSKSKKNECKAKIKLNKQN